MTNGPTLAPRLLGRAENARAVLGRILGASDMTYHEWVALTLASAADSTVASNQLVGRMVGALNIDRATARGAIARLIGAVLLEPDEPSHLRLSDAGRERYGRLRAAVDESVARLNADIPAEDLATAGRVLSELTARANDQLAQPGKEESHAR